MELFYSILETGEWACIDHDLRRTKRYILKYVFTFPFLLHEVLAVSALHLSTCRPAQKSMYREEATQLQSHARRLFNETVRDLNPQNIVPAFLFTAVLGIATFFETFHENEVKDNEMGVLFERIVQSIRLLQGVRAIVQSDGWWAFLNSSDIKDILVEDSAGDVDWIDEVVERFKQFHVHVLEWEGLDEEQKMVCDEAVGHLITVYRSAFKDKDRCGTLHRDVSKYAIRWWVLVPPAYTELLIQRKPEALVILGHFAVILHVFRGCWIVGDAGYKLLMLVEAELTQPWHAMLLWPRSFVEAIE
jgi:hypothetical protein